MKVTILVGAHAYACIEQEGRKTDFLLTPGKGAPASLRDTAAELRQEASRKQALADLADAAAAHIEADGRGALPRALGGEDLLVDVKETQGGATIRAAVEGREHVFYVGSTPAADLARCADVSEADAAAKRALTVKLDERARVARMLAIKYEKGLP
jgi:hypothetical protein